MRLLLTLLLTYAAGVLASRWLVFHAFALDTRTIAAMVAVPLVQTAVLLAWRKWSAGQRS